MVINMENITIPIILKVKISFRLEYLRLTVTNSEGQSQGQAHLDSEYLRL